MTDDAARRDHAGNPPTRPETVAFSPDPGTPPGLGALGVAGSRRARCATRRAALRSADAAGSVTGPPAGAARAARRRGMGQVASPPRPLGGARLGRHRPPAPGHRRARAARPAGASAPVVDPAASRSPVDDSSAVVNAAANVSPAVVRITATGVTTDVFGGTIPGAASAPGSSTTAPAGSSRTATSSQIASDEIADELTVELKDGRELDGHGLRHRHAHGPRDREGRRRRTCRPRRSASRRTSRSASSRSPSARRWARTRAR